MTKRAGRRLPLSEDVPQVAPGVLERHPNDGWELADPVRVDPFTERAIQGLVRAILPPSPAPRSPELDARVARHVRRMIAYTPVGVGLGILAVMHMVDWAPV
ncbi:MAG: hypothetical protein MUF54_22395, partial [Polyangiaceae bacterium]|nr:hypothetical protein [Polyangiaceae bacterium]